MTFGFSKSAAGPTEPDRPNRLEGEFQSELHGPVFTRTNERIAGREVRSQARIAERAASLEFISRFDGTRGAKRVGSGRMIQDVKYFVSELGPVPLLEPEARS